MRRCRWIVPVLMLVRPLKAFRLVNDVFRP